MQWPWVSRKKHIGKLRDLIESGEQDRKKLLAAFDKDMDDMRRFFQEKVDLEYQRARAEGIAQVHRWAVEVNYHLFMGDSPFDRSTTQTQRALAAAQDAEHQFRPTRTVLGEQDVTAQPGRTSIESAPAAGSTSA